MTAEAAVLPPTIDAAAHAQREAMLRVRMHQNSYSQVRLGRDSLATTRARSEWGLAVLELIEASVNLAQAKDNRSLPWAADTGYGGKVFRSAGPGHEPLERAWADYQEIRRTGNAAAAGFARDRWRAEFVGWFQQLAARRATEDEAHVQKLRGQLDDSQRLGAVKDMTGPSQGAERVVRASLEWERAESIRRAKIRDETGLGGWRPANPRR